MSPDAAQEQSRLETTQYRVMPSAELMSRAAQMVLTNEKHNYGPTTNRILRQFHDLVRTDETDETDDHEPPVIAPVPEDISRIGTARVVIQAAVGFGALAFAMHRENRSHRRFVRAFDKEFPGEPQEMFPPKDQALRYAMGLLKQYPL